MPFLRVLIQKWIARLHVGTHLIRCCISVCKPLRHSIGLFHIFLCTRKKLYILFRLLNLVSLRYMLWSQNIQQFNKNISVLSDISSFTAKKYENTCKTCYKGANSSFVSGVSIKCWPSRLGVHPTPTAYGSPLYIITTQQSYHRLSLPVI